MSDKSLNDLKIEFSSRHKDLEDFLQEKLKALPKDLIRDELGSSLSFRSIKSDRDHFERVIKIIKKSFETRATANGLGDEDKAKFAEIIKNLSDAFDIMNETKNEQYRQKAPDKEDMFQSLTELREKITELHHFTETKLHATEHELATYGTDSGERKDYQSARLSALVNQKGRFLDRLDAVDSGIKKLENDISSGDETKKIAERLIQDIRDSFESYNKGRNARGRAFGSKYSKDED